jgi:hypothetical protein
MTPSPTISLFRKPANHPPAPVERERVASFADLAEALRALADLGSRWRWAAVRPQGSK